MDRMVHSIKIVEGLRRINKVAVSVGIRRVNRILGIIKEGVSMVKGLWAFSRPQLEILF